jgi:hypothetical protein
MRRNNSPHGITTLPQLRKHFESLDLVVPQESAAMAYDVPIATNQPRRTPPSMLNVLPGSASPCQIPVPSDEVNTHDGDDVSSEERPPLKERRVILSRFFFWGFRGWVGGGGGEALPAQRWGESLHPHKAMQRQTSFLSVMRKA